MCMLHMCTVCMYTCVCKMEREREREGEGERERERNVTANQPLVTPMHVCICVHI